MPQLPAKLPSDVKRDLVLSEEFVGLTVYQQRWLLAYATNGGNKTQAAISAGSPPGTAADTGCKLSRMPKMLEALAALSRCRIQAQAHRAADVLIEIMDDPTHKDRLKAAGRIMDMSGLQVIAQQEIKVTHDHGSEIDMIRRIAELAKGLGVDPRNLLGDAGITAEVIDAEFTVLPPPEEPDPWTVQPGEV